jgi:multimeric flavodoxin WrbA
LQPEKCRREGEVVDRRPAKAVAGCARNARRQGRHHPRGRSRHQRVKSDEGEGDAWPLLRKRVVEADILIIGTPIWLGQPSSVAKRVLERMDAFLEETDARGRMPSYGKVALAVVVGNEDGAHHTAAELFQALTEVGFTIPAGGVTYWVGEAMGGKEYKDFWKSPKAVAEWTPLLASNAAHLARLLKKQKYPGIKGGR